MFSSVCEVDKEKLLKIFKKMSNITASVRGQARGSMCMVGQFCIRLQRLKIADKLTRFFRIDKII